VAITYWTGKQIMSVKLPLYQQIALLAIHDDKGTFEAEFVEQLLSGSIIAELLLLGCIKVEGKDKKINYVKALPFKDNQLDNSLALLRNTTKPQSLKNTLHLIAKQKNFKHDVANSLCDAGILKAEQDKVLFLFTRNIYPEINPIPEQEIKNSIKTLIARTGSNVNPQTVVLLSLMKSSGLHKKHFDKAFLKQHQERIESLIKGDVVGEATQEVIEACQMAIMMAAILPTVITTTVVSG
jgi:hypothetical protein